ncbi:prepilin peptidase [Salmonella enterica]
MFNVIMLSLLSSVIVFYYSIRYINLSSIATNHSPIKRKFIYLYISGVPIFVFFRFIIQDDSDIITWMFWCTWSISIIDFLLMLIPRNLVYGIVILWFIHSLQTDIVLMKQELCAAVILYIFFLLLYHLPPLLLKRKMLGYGDVRLAGSLGCFLSVKTIPEFVFLSSLTCFLWGGYSFLCKKTTNKLPFAPFMCLSMWIIYFRY